MTLQKIPTGIKFPLFEGVKLINAAIEAADKAQEDSSSAKIKSENALATSQSAETKADSVQEQFNQVVIDGDSSVEAAQARVNAEGNSFTTLKDRLDTSDELMAERAIKTDGGLDRLKATSKFVTSLSSYVGLVNTEYTGDNGTRFYILPKAKVSSGVGGVLKIFGDDYQNGADYRDLGLYFHADQAGDKGYFGNGVFWINGKVFDGTGAQYLGKNPDIGFSFQDGETVAGRITRLGAQWPVWVFGKDKPSLHGFNPNILMEVQGEVGFKNNTSLKFRNSANNADAGVRMNSDDYFFMSLINGLKVFTNGGTEQLRVSGAGVEPKTKLVQNYIGISNNLPTPSVKTGNVFVISNTTTTSITDLLDGTPGQIVTLVINDFVTTIKSNSAIKLTSDFRPSNTLSNITLARLGTQWVEMFRKEF